MKPVAFLRNRAFLNLAPIAGGVAAVAIWQMTVNRIPLQAVLQYVVTTLERVVEPFSLLLLVAGALVFCLLVALLAERMTGRDNEAKVTIASLRREACSTVLTFAWASLLFGVCKALLASIYFGAGPILVGLIALTVAYFIEPPTS